MPTIASSGPTPASHGGSTAPVLEFVCLFTHDLRRKQKRWQDGRVKYHLFNKRVMVYDDRGNSIGDMYWRRDWEFGEGEEVETERGGAIVQVAECVGRQDQDLSELLDKRVKEKEQRAAARPAAHVPMHTPLSISRTPIQQDRLQARHRPLNRLLGTPTGHHGRAVVPTESPYEQRHTPGQTPDGQSNPQASKKRRYDDSPPSKKGYAQALFGTQLSLSGGPMSSAPIRRPAISRSQHRVDISSSAEDGPEDARPTDTTQESNDRSNKRPDVQDSRENPGWEEQASRGQESLSTTSKVSPHNEPVTPSVDTEKRDVQQPGHTSNPRGVSSHFTHASNESQRRASLLRGMGIKAGQSRNIGTPIAEKQVGKPNEVPRRQLAYKSPEPELEPEPEPELELEHGINLYEVEDLEQDPAKLPERHETVARSKRNRPEPQNQPKAKRRKDLGQAPPPVARSDSGAGIPTAQDTMAATVPEVPKEPRTELRLKSRQKRGLLVVAEMAKKPKAKIGNQKAKRSSVRPGPGPEESLRNSEEQGDAHEQLDGETPEIPARQRPASPDPEDKDPFASLPNSPQVVPSKPVPQPARNPRAKKKPTKERDVAEDDDHPFDSPSPEPTKRSKVVAKKPKSSELVHDISDDTDEENEPLQIERTSKPNPKKPQKKTGQGKTTAEAQSDEDIEQEPEQSPPARKTRTSRRKVDKGSREEEKPEKVSRWRSNKKRQLSESAPSEESGQEDLPKAPARPRVVKMTRKSVKSREVFGYAPSSSPPPPTFGPGSPPARPIPQAVNHAIPTLNINEDVGTKAGPVPTVANPVATPTNSGGNILSRNMPSALASVPSLQPRNSLPHTDKGGIQDAVTLEVAARTVQPSDGEPNRKGLGRVPSIVHVVGRTTSSVNRLPSPTASSLQTVEAREETAAGAQKNLGQDEQQPIVDTEKTRTLHAESHKPATSPPRRPTAIAHPEQRLSGTDGPIRPRPVPGPPEAHPAAVSAPVLPKIVNPASRGRKAALKSDAAGQTPQSILPPVEAVANLVARAAVRPGTVTEERPKLKMTFPGFVSAREGGPWSRESDDLLGPDRSRPS